MPHPTKTKSPPEGGPRSIHVQILPEPDALQNGKGLLFEFLFGQLNTAKGEKRLLPEEAFDEAAREMFTQPETRSLKDRILFAQECRQKLLDFPALTRRDIAKQLGVTTARLNQILRSTQKKNPSHDP